MLVAVNGEIAALVFNTLMAFLVFKFSSVCNFRITAFIRIALLPVICFVLAVFSPLYLSASSNRTLSAK